MSPTRRQFGRFISSAALWSLLPSEARAEPNFGLPAADLGRPYPFTFTDLARKAQRLSRSAYRERKTASAKILDRIDYDDYQRIRYRPERTLLIDTNYPVQFFHLGKYAQSPVRMSIVADGQTRDVIYRRDLFDIPKGNPASQLNEDIGFAGFRIMDGAMKSDWFSAIGASYFRSSAPHNQYGLSARGLAVNIASGVKEEFPKFVHAWLEFPSRANDPMTVYALLDGPSVTGAYRMQIERAPDKTGLLNCEMIVEASIYLRADVERIGIAPFSSMFWYGEAAVPHPRDWRPEIHDNDGLALFTGKGERIWRPLRNPPRVAANTFADHNPKGFGLLQRDREFDHYLDDGVFYDKRPSTWVEPIGDWGEGTVLLVENPTGEETWDNVVTCWCPTGFGTAGQERTFKYKLTWLDDVPFPQDLARSVGTWTGIGGPPGLGYSERNPNKTKIVIDFEGSCFAGLGRTDGVELIVSSSRGNVSNVANYPVVGQAGRWRALFDVEATGADDVDLRAYLKFGDRALTETWIYQLNPLTA